MRPLFVFIALLLCFSSCGPRPRDSGYTIAIDPTWYPLHVAGREKNILAFSIELLTEIARVEDLQMGVVQMNWNNLMWGLREHKYNAMLSTMRPYTFYQKDYTFSHPYLLTGPVIVLPQKVKSDKIDGKEIGVIRGSAAALILQTTPNILLQGYDSIVDLFDALDNQHVDGIALEILAASNYMRDLFPGKFRIASSPLNDMGLRLISIYGEEPALMKRFDKGLKKLKKQGIYEKLLRKWGLSPDGESPDEIEQKASAFIQSFF